jgi:hypothetical protein
MSTGEKRNMASLLQSMRAERLVLFKRFTLEDIPIISRFLNSTWSQHYSKMGSPVFTEDYLSWVLGGPHKEKNHLFGAVINGELIAYQSFIYRRISCHDREIKAFLNTHLAVSPHIDLRLRMDCMLQLAEQTLLFHPDSECHDPACEATYAFVEEGKPLKSLGDKLSAKYFHVERKTCSKFNQFVVMPARLRTYLQENPLLERSFTLRSATEKDVPQLTQLFNQIPEEPLLVMTLTEDELCYYCFGHSAHKTALVEYKGTIAAFITYYPLETVKNGEVSLYVLIDFLIADRMHEHSRDCLATLLLEAVNHAEDIGAKAVVLENATYLDYDTYRPLGLMPSFRKMNLMLVGKDDSIEYSGNFRCDVK